MTQDAASRAALNAIGELDEYEVGTLKGLSDMLEGALALVNSGSPRMAEMMILDYLARCKTKRETQ